jgi:hypothetical protein
MSVQVRWRGDTRANINQTFPGGSNANAIAAKELVVDTDNNILGIGDSSIVHWLPKAPLILSGPGPFVLTDPFTDARIYCNTASAPVSITLPAPATSSPASGGFTDSTGQQIWVFDIAGNAAANNITVSPSSGLTINGASSFVLSTNRQRKVFEFTGTNWNA